jgi:hypothetical protein
MEDFGQIYKRMPQFAQHQIEQEVLNFRQEVNLVCFNSDLKFGS